MPKGAEHTEGEVSWSLLPRYIDRKAISREAELTAMKGHVSAWERQVWSLQSDAVSNHCGRNEAIEFLAPLN